MQKCGLGVLYAFVYVMIFRVSSYCITVMQFLPEHFKNITTTFIYFETIRTLSFVQYD